MLLKSAAKLTLIKQQPYNGSQIIEILLNLLYNKHVHLNSGYLFDCRLSYHHHWSRHEPAAHHLKQLTINN